MKIECEYCGSANREEREDCRSCDANLPVIPELRKVTVEPIVQDFEMMKAMVGGDVPESPYFMDGGTVVRDAPSLYSDWGMDWSE